MTAVFVLTVRQLAGSRRLWLVLGLVCLPVLAAVVFRVGDTTTTSARFADNVTRTRHAAAILPRVKHLFATSVDGDGMKGAAATGLGLRAGAAAFAALFTWAGLATRHALLLGLVYVFVWEATLAAYLDGIRFLSIRRYTLSLIHALDGARLATLDNPLSAAGALVGTAVVLAAFTALTVRKLTRMDVP